MRKWLTNRPLLTGVAVIALLLFLAVRPRAIDVELATVNRGALRVTLDEEGRTRVRDRFLVTAPVAGTISRIEWDAGDRVTRGQALATIHPEVPRLLDARTRAELRARVDVARAALDQARAEERRAAAANTQAQSEVARTRGLHKGGGS
jgi:HlyD family secretion protein